MFETRGLRSILVVYRPMAAVGAANELHDGEALLGPDAAES